MKYLIKDTTKEQRKEIVKRAFAIGTAGGNLPTDKAIQLVKKYIDGEMELNQVENAIMQLYNEN